ncbi:MAG: hypothetical protein PHO90_02045 [Candidatus Pacebacteria bacterium]|nr:hypothetical protein [Candidatus Paceibacterota bacterium]
MIDYHQEPIKKIDFIVFLVILIIVVLYYKIPFNFKGINLNLDTSDIQIITAIVQAFASLILIAVTAYYAYQTKKTVETMKHSEKERNRPRISIYIKQREDWLNLVELIITNHGQGVANNVNFKLSEDLTLLQTNKKLSQLDIIKNGIKTFAPNHTLVLPLVSLIGRINELNNSKIIVTVDYQDNTNKENFSDNFFLDFNSLIETQLGSPAIYQIAESLKNIANCLKKK